MNKCGCEYGEDCTRTTVCATQNAVQDVTDALEQAQARINRLERIAKAADLVASMSSYDEEDDEVDPCHMVYFEELEAELIPWREQSAGDTRK